jgi:SRSO17 transposase
VGQENRPRGQAVAGQHGQDRKRGGERQTSVWADEGVYYTLEVEPYTPKHHFQKGTSDPRFRTKLKIAQQLVERSIGTDVPFRAVVADSFYGEDEGFRQALSELGAGYVLRLFVLLVGLWALADRRRGGIGRTSGGRSTA